MELIRLITQDVLKQAIEESYATKCISDSNAAGGAICEAKLCSRINRVLKGEDSNLFCITQKQLDSAVKRGNYNPIFPNNRNWFQFRKDIKKAFHPYSASDLFLMEKQNDVVRFVDAISLKTSFSQRPTFVVHNDANGEIYNAVNGQGFMEGAASIGKILQVSLNTKTAGVEVFYFDKQFPDLIEMFHPFDPLLGSPPKNKHGDIVYEIENVQGVKIFNRGQSPVGRKQTSFNRGVYLKNKRMINSLLKKGALLKMLGFTIDCAAIEEEVDRKILNGEF
tara:strand:- start:368 stop:1204 length:837 start_codon:yes stop_codon:yes gene_type:complete